MLSKLLKILKYPSLLFPAILLAVVSPVGAGVAHAATGPIGWMLEKLGGAGEGLAWLVAQVINYLIYVPSSWVLNASAFVFDAVVPYSLGVGTPNAFQSAFITEGWGLMRDITNMVFIFAMLYIAIATILQIGAGRNTKALIINIIIIALFVNFSLFLAQVVIDAANLLALEFYRALAGSPGGHGLAAIFLQGFNPQLLLGTASFDAWVTQYNQSNLTLVAIYLFGGVVQLVAAYAIFLAAFLFIGRIIVLWILMIVSPLAFAAYIIPKFAGKFTEWWDRLLKQAFVAPIFLFFFYIFALFVQSGLGAFLNAAAAQSGQDGVVQSVFKVALGFSLTVAFLVIALRITKSLSGEVAGYATKAVGFTMGAAAAAVTGPAGAARLAKLAGTFNIPTAGMAGGASIGRVVGAPLAPIREKIYGKGRELGAAAAKKVVEAGRKAPVGAILRGLGIASVAGRLEAAAKGGAKTDIEKAKKDFGDLSENALLTKYGLSTTSAEVRTGIIELLGAKKKLGRDKEGKWRIDPTNIKKTLGTVKERGYDTEKEIEDKYLWQYAEMPEERKKAAKTLTPDAMKEIGKVKREGEKIGADGKKEELPSDFFDATKNSDGSENTEVFDTAVKNMTSAHFKMLLDPEVRSDFSENFVKNLKDAMVRQKKKVADELRKKGDEKGAQDHEASKYQIEDYFRDIQNVRGASAIKEPSVRGYFESNGILYRKKTKDEEGDEEEGGGGGVAKTSAPKIEVVTPPRARKETPRPAAPATGPSPLKSAAEIAEERARADEEERQKRAGFYEEHFGAGEKNP